MDKELDTNEIEDFEPKEIDESEFSKKLNQQKLSRHELDEMFLLE